MELLILLSTLLFFHHKIHLKKENLPLLGEKKVMLNYSVPPIPGYMGYIPGKTHLFSTRILGGLRVFSPEFARRKNGTWVAL